MSNGNDPFGNGGDGGDWGDAPGGQPGQGQPGGGAQPGQVPGGQPGQVPGGQPGQVPGGQPGQVPGSQPPNPQGGAQPPMGQPGPQGDEHVDMNYGQPMSQPPAQTPGTELQSTGSKLENDDIIAMVISAFFPGVGHMMLGQTVKGIVILAASIFTCGGMGLLWIAAIVDCYLVAMTRKYRAVDDWEFFPDMNKHFG